MDSRRDDSGRARKPAAGMAPGHDTIAPIPDNVRDWETAYLAAYTQSLADNDNPDFQAGMAQAKHLLIGLFRHELIRRALEPNPQAIFNRGIQVGTRWEYDNKLLLEVAERLAPDEFIVTKKTEIHGDIVRTFRFEMGEGPDELEAEDADVRELPPSPQDH